MQACALLNNTRAATGSGAAAWTLLIYSTMDWLQYMLVIRTIYQWKAFFQWNNLKNLIENKCDGFYFQMKHWRSCHNSVSHIYYMFQPIAVRQTKTFIYNTLIIMGRIWISEIWRSIDLKDNWNIFSWMVSLGVKHVHLSFGACSWLLQLAPFRQTLMYHSCQVLLCTFLWSHQIKLKLAVWGCS